MKVKFFKKNRGFSLLEVLLVITIFGILLGITLPFSAQFFRNHDFQVTSNEIIDQIRQTQLFARLNYFDDAWGIRFEPKEIIVFKGDKYQNRDSDFDEITELSEEFVFPEISEIVFQKTSGLPDTSGELIIEKDLNSKTIEINEKGQLFY